jgi:two-component system sensor histidine kinase FlrB
MPSGWPDPALPAAATGVVTRELGHAGTDDEKFLLRAFRSFAEAAESLERSYGRLRGEVEKLRRELEETNRDLAQSLEENRGMRVYLDRVLEGLPCGVLVASSDGEISRANPEAMRLLGIAAEMPATNENHRDNDGDGNSVAGFGPISGLSAAVRQLLDRTSQIEGEQELSIPAGNGAVRWLAARRASLADSGKPSSVFIVRDVTGRKRLEQAEAQLRRDQALAEMATLLAHEIRNPLGSLELFAGLLAESDLGGERRQWVEHVQAGLRTLAATVNNVLHFHSLPEPERSAVDLGELIDWACDFLAPLARRSHIALSKQNRLHGVCLSADRHRLEQVLLNLVLNAVHAMPGGGWIEIGGKIEHNVGKEDNEGKEGDEGEAGEAGKEGEVGKNGGDSKSVSIRVADTGPGISPEHLRHIFQPGFSTRAAGPGLGLPVCRKIIEQHGGTIRAASLPGRGAVFTLTLPISFRPIAEGREEDPEEDAQEDLESGRAPAETRSGHQTGDQP